MESTGSPESANLLKPIWKRPWAVLLATIFVGSLGSGLWDIAVKPGLGWAMHTVLYVITFGSDVVRDQAYANATMDPTILPSLILYIAVVSAGFVAFLIHLSSEFSSLIPQFLKTSDVSQLPDIDTLDRQARIKAIEDRVAVLDEQRAKLRRRRRILLVPLGLISG